MEQNTDFSKITACGECCEGCGKRLKGLCKGCIEADGYVPEWAGSGRCKIHACAREHNVQFCGLCAEFPCTDLPSIIHWNPNITEHLRRLADIYQEPDTPIPFGMKMSWLAIKADHPESVMDKLGCTDRKVSNWESAFAVIFNSGQVFVTPCFDGYVLVLSYDKPANEIDMSRLRELAAQFEEVQYFSSHRVVDLCCWVKFAYGELVRSYYYVGDGCEVYWNEGELTVEEKDLELTALPYTDMEDWDNITFPDEEHVIKIAEKWGVDPLMGKYQNTKSTGYLCVLS